MATGIIWRDKSLQVYVTWTKLKMYAIRIKWNSPYYTIEDKIKLSYRIYWQLSSRVKTQRILETNDGEWNVKFNAISNGEPVRNKHITYVQFRIKTARNICHLT